MDLIDLCLYLGIEPCSSTQQPGYLTILDFSYLLTHRNPFLPSSVVLLAEVIGDGSRDGEPHGSWISSNRTKDLLLTEEV